MSEKSPSTATVRHRRGRATPSSAVPLSLPPKIPSFPLQDILNIQIHQNPQPPSSLSNPPETLKVFLRIRPLTIHSSNSKDQNFSENLLNKNAWPKNPKLKNATKPKCRKNLNSCISVNDANSITISPPLGLQDSKRVKSEVYEGFANVFASESTQVEVYEKLLKPLVDDFLKGKCGMLAAVGPSGSGKTHTMFGCVREPGMVPLALGDIFSSYENKSEEESRTLYMSMFEISSEKGKSERISDLLQGVPDLSMQHSTVKGVQQVKIHNAQQAEILLASGLLKRATAGTNTNSQSSRSQCIINFRQATSELDDQDDYSELTIVDLAGAEREKRTGNQGTRLLESNFINNTSMVFGLCLRALLEHQKNPKRQLQKHFQSSMLTRYLRDYLEGKKRMSLILTVKPLEEDYLDTSFVLRQAAPYMQIKFSNVEQPNNLTCKRPLQTLNKAEPLKRRKHARLGSSEIKCEKIPGDPQIIEEGHAIGSVEDANLLDISINSEEFSSEKRISMSVKKPLLTFTEADRNYKVLEGLSKAMWKVAKELNKKLKETQQENCILNAELAKERKRCSDLESLIQDVKFRSSCCEEKSESNIYNHENLQKPSSTTVSSTMEGSNQNNIDRGRDCIPSSTTVSCTMEISNQDNIDHGRDCIPSSTTVSSTMEGSNQSNIDHNQDSIPSSTTVSSTMKGSNQNNIDHDQDCIPSSTTVSSTMEGSNQSNIDHNQDSIPSSTTVSSTMNGSNQNNIDHDQDCIEKNPNACVPSDVLVEVSKTCSPQLQAGTSSENVDYRSNHKASDGCTKSCLRSCEGLDKTTESYSSGETKFIDKLKAAVYCSDEEACLSSVSAVLPITNFNDSGDSENLINRTDVRREYMHDNDDNLTTGNTTHLEIDELTDCAASLSCSMSENFSLCEEEQQLTCSSNLESAVGSSQSSNLTMEDRSLSTQDEQPENIHESLVPPVAGTSLEDTDATCSQGCDDNNVPLAAGISSLKKESQNLSKPKRRLLPASSLLLRDMSSLAIEDETAKRKGGRVEKKNGFDEKIKTQSKTSLLQLLQRNVVR